MKSQAAPIADSVDSVDSPTTKTTRASSDTRLRGRRLVAARAIWIALFIWFLANFAWSLPSQLALFQHPTPQSGELPPSAVIALRQAGIPLETYAWVAVGFGAFIMLAATALALVLFWRRSDDWMVLLVSLFFPAYCLESIGPSESFRAVPTGSPLTIANAILLATVSFAIIYAVFLLFPSGRFTPSWSWALLVAFVVWIAFRAAAPNVGILFLGYPVFLVAAVACQVYRYRAISTVVQRQQTRWAVFSLVTALLANQVFWWTAGLTPLDSTVYPPFAYLTLYATVLLLPTAFFIAIQRYHLYEIDTIIRRTLIYGLLTAILTGIYAVCVFAAQSITHITGSPARQQPIVIVGTTLLIAALFAPLRRRIQVAIDRAFYRSKYNATATLNRFGAKMRTVTDLEVLCDNLVDVVEQTVQPAHLHLWLRQAEDASRPSGNRQESSGEWVELSAEAASTGMFADGVEGYHIAHDD